MKNNAREIQAPRLSSEEWSETILQEVHKAQRRWATEQLGEPCAFGGPDFELRFAPINTFLEDVQGPAFLYSWVDLGDGTILGCCARPGPLAASLPDVLTEAVHDLRREWSGIWIQLRGAPLTGSLRRHAAHLGIRLTEAPGPPAEEA